MRLRHRDDHAVVPWKNGGGVTREVDRLDGPEGFLWRVSIATVARPGPFSRFDGIDRTIAVMAGAGLDLAFAGGGTVALTRDTPPLPFPGEAAIEAAVPGGETTDLNAMSRRGRFRHVIERLDVAAPQEIEAAGAATVLVFNGPATVETPAGPLTAGPLDALTGLAAGTRVRIVPKETAAVFVIRFHEI